MTAPEQLVATASGEGTSLDVGQLGRTQLAALSVASFVPASGMALMPFVLVTAAGDQAWSSAVVTVLAMTAIGATIVPFATRFIGSGSIYSYVSEVFGPWAKYLVAASLLAGFVVQLGAIAGVISIYLGSFLTSVGVPGASSEPAQFAMYAVALGGPAVISVRGLQASVRVAVLLAVVSVPLMVAVTTASGVHTGLHLDTQFNLADVDLNATFAGVAIGSSFFVGFESCTSLAAETRDPRRNVPLALMSAPVILGIVYTLCVIVQTPGVMRLDATSSSGISPPAALANASGLGSNVATAVDLVLAIAMIAAAIGFTNYGARFVMTLASDGLLPQKAATIHRRFRTPHFGLLLVAVLGFIVISAAALVSSSPTVAYTAASVLAVSVWIPAYVVIAAGSILLARREGRLTLRVVLVAGLGAAAMVWIYLHGLLDPPAHPLDAMTWVAPLLYAAVLAALVVGRCLSRTGSVENFAAH